MYRRYLWELDRDKIHLNSGLPDNSDTECGSHLPSNVMNVHSTKEKKLVNRASTSFIKRKVSRLPTQEDVLSEKAINGDIGMWVRHPAKVVRVFTSSTFTDTKYERNMLMVHSYPKIKEHCRSIGYEFQVVDMRWGVRDEATDDHMGTELCLKELKLCRELSTGPCFVSLLSHKYGYTAFPRVIEAKEYEALLGGMESEENKELFMKWYTRDDNCVPPAYVLSSISVHYPDFISTDQVKQKQAKTLWWADNQNMQEALDETASQIFDKEKARKYIMSVTETEVQEGLLKPQEASSYSIWLKRDITDIEEQRSSYALSRFIECLGPEQKWRKSRQMLKELKEERMPPKLDQDKILRYSVHWSPDTGINPGTNVEHRKYLEQMCADFTNVMANMIDKAVDERTKFDDPLIEECLQHIRFCQIKCESFYGREQTLQKIKAYVQGDSNKPLVLHGTSGTGKTSIMAMAAKMSKDWTKEKPAIVLRFIGTSPDSSSLVPLLYSITSQIRRVYNLPVGPEALTFNSQVQEFHDAVNLGKTDKPLLIFLDSLDQLDPANDARKLMWLMGNLEPGTKMIVSTLPEPIYECFPALKVLIPADEDTHFIEVPIMRSNDVRAVVNSWLEKRERKLTEEQLQIVVEAFSKCSSPLFLRLSFDEATTWTSFAPKETLILQDTIRASIDYFFKKLEKMHGQIIVSRTLAYMTLTLNGATEAELEDILSCDDDVLNDVYMYWTPPVRRLPPLLIVRIRSDLNQYLVERGADGVRVIYWYHRQFIEAAEARYCSDEAGNKIIHSNIADFFKGKWSKGKKKPYVSSKGENGEEDRHVARQPLKFEDNQYNTRALNNLPYHRTMAGDLVNLCYNCLHNVEFLLHKLEALPLTSLLKDFVRAKKAFPKKQFRDARLLSKIHAALLMSQKGLITDPGQLLPQMIGRLPYMKPDFEGVNGFKTDCYLYPRKILHPSKNVLLPIGSRLKHCIPAHTANADMIDVTTNETYGLTVCQENKEVIIWNLAEARQQRSVFDLKLCSRALFCNNDKWIVCAERDNTKLVFQEVITGRNIGKVELDEIGGNVLFCTVGKNNDCILVFSKQMCSVYSLDNEPKLTESIRNRCECTFGRSNISTGSVNYSAAVDDSKTYITVLDLNTKTFHKPFRGFDAFVNDYGDDETIYVDAVAIHPKETYIAYTTQFTSEVIFADFNGTHLKSIPGNIERSFTSIQFAADGRDIYVLDMNTYRMFSVSTLEEQRSDGFITHPKDITDIKSGDSHYVYGVVDGGNLCVWNLWKRKRDDFFDCSLIYHWDIQDMEPLHLNNPRYMLVCGKKTKQSRTPTLTIVDIGYEKNEKSWELPELDDPTILSFNSHEENKVFLVLNRNVYVLNIETMKLEMKFEGHLSKRISRSTVVVSPKRQLVCTSKGNLNLNVYDTTSGKVAFILTAGQAQTIDRIVVNETGKIVCASTDEGPILLFDTDCRQHLYNIDNDSVYGDFNSSLLTMNQIGDRLVFSTNKPYKEGKNTTCEVEHLVVWDIPERKEICRLVDFEQLTQEVQEDLFDTTGVENVYALDDEHMLTTSYDYIIRIYNIVTGKLLYRLEGHSTSVQIALSEKAPFIVSYGCLNEEDCLRVWDKDTFQCVATYSLDRSINKLFWSKDGTFFTTVRKQHPPDVTRWIVKYGGVVTQQGDGTSLRHESEKTTNIEALNFAHPKLPFGLDIEENLRFMTEGDPLKENVAENAKDFEL